MDDAAKAVTALEKLEVRDLEVLTDGVIRLYSHLDKPQVISRALAEAGVALFGLNQRGSSLEDYFLNLVGGKHHA